jgi:hypothetical protein
MALPVAVNINQLAATKIETLHGPAGCCKYKPTGGNQNRNTTWPCRLL